MTMQISDVVAELERGDDFELAGHELDELLGSGDLVIHIRTGNAEMQTGDDLSFALRQAVGYLASNPEPVESGVTRKLYDVNGNTVGELVIR